MNHGAWSRAAGGKTLTPTAELLVQMLASGPVAAHGLVVTVIRPQLPMGMGSGHVLTLLLEGKYPSGTITSAASVTSCSINLGVGVQTTTKKGTQPGPDRC